MEGFLEEDSRHQNYFRDHTKLAIMIDSHLPMGV